MRTKLKLMIRDLIKMPNLIYNYVTFLYRKVSYFTFPKIEGRIYMVCSPGSISFGENVRINSSLESNPIGGSTRTILFARSNATLEIGNNVGISNSCVFSAEKVKIGNNVLIGGDCKIYDTDFHSVEYDHRMEKPDTHIKTEPVLIADGAFIGAHSTILKGVTIGEKSVIAAGSVVTKSVPANEMCGGTGQTYTEVGRVDNKESVEVSIIIPMYNASKTIERCIRSCIPMSLEDWEIIVVDDGSSDSSYDIAYSMSEKDDHIRIFKEENAGVSSARNFGLHKANGKFILFVDADDVVNGKAIAGLLNKMESLNCELIQGAQWHTHEVENFEEVFFKPNQNSRYVTVPSKEIKTVTLNRLSYLHGVRDCTPEMVESVHGCYGKIIKRQLIIDNDISFDENLGLGEDLLFYIKVLEASSTVALSDIPFYIIYENNNSSTRSYNPKMPGYAAHAIKILAQYLKDKDYKTVDVSEAILNHLEVAIQSCFAHKKNPIAKTKRAAAFEEFIVENEISDIINTSAGYIISYNKSLSGKRKWLLWLLKERKFKLFMLIKMINNQLKR